MEILFEPKEMKNLSLALGFFDGVHRAHKKIIQSAVSEAVEKSSKSAVITFIKSPYSILNKIEPNYITNLEKKAELIASIGVNYLFVLDFSKFIDFSAKDYIDNVLIKYFSPICITTGFNHRFGKFAKGGPELLRENKNFKYIEIPPVKYNNTLVSSTNIKKRIQNGDIEAANNMLGRNFSISGKVVKGNGIARTLGYNTANIIWDKNIVKPSYGVYFGFGEIGGAKYKALINFGTRPSVDKFLKETLEVHLVNFNQDIYDKTLNVEFVSKIRDEIKFNSLSELKDRICADYDFVINELI